jgi:predicted nuclease of restriction endonuclease-like (RecB) superfamily
MSREGQRTVRPEDLIRAPFILDFLKLPEGTKYLGVAEQ